MGKDYDNDFSNWCNENGMDLDSLAEELKDDGDAANSMLVDFGENEFPLKDETLTEDARKEAIFRILQDCYNNPSKAWDVANSLPECMFVLVLYSLYIHFMYI